MNKISKKYCSILRKCLSVVEKINLYYWTKMMMGLCSYGWGCGEPSSGVVGLCYPTPSEDCGYPPELLHEDLIV